MTGIATGTSASKVPLEEFGASSDGRPGFRRVAENARERVRHAFINIKDSFVSRASDALIQPHKIAEQQFASATLDERRRIGAPEVAIHRCSVGSA